MANHLPIDGEQVARAAEEMIAQHGDSALVEADKQIRTCESEGVDFGAETWKLIREVIRQIQQSDQTIEGNKKVSARVFSVGMNLIRGLPLACPVPICFGLVFGEFENGCSGRTGVAT